MGLRTNRRLAIAVVVVVAACLLFGLVVATVVVVGEEPTCGTRLADRVLRKDLATPNITGSFPTDDGRVLNYDFYRPPDKLHGDAGAPPLVIYVHGGGWSSLSRDLDRSTPPLLLCERGYAVASIDYRRTADGVSWPTPAADVAAGVRALGLASTTSASPIESELDFDLDRVALWGDSAGGHLASFVGVAANDEDTPDGLIAESIDLGPELRIRGVIGGAAITDLTDPTFATWAEEIPGVDRCPPPADGTEPCQGFASHWPCSAADQTPGEPECTTVIEASMLWLLGCEERSTGACGQVHQHPRAAEASPTSYVDDCDPPHMLLSDSTAPAQVDGEFQGDLLVPPSQQRRLVETLERAGVDTQSSRTTDGTGHIAITGESAVIDDLDEFLQRTFKDPSAPC